MRSLLCQVACVTALLAPHAIRAQSTDEAGLRSAVESLFTAMRKSDTAAVRAAFLPTARVIPMPADAASAPPNALNLDAFVRFAGGNAPESWNERVWQPRALIDGTLGTLWFDYDVVRNNAVAQCGVNSVQLQQTAAGWKILSMAFTAKRTDCPHR
jgi:hypothetical protein